MQAKSVSLAAVFILTGLPVLVSAQTKLDAIPVQGHTCENQPVEEIRINPQPIFDASTADTIALHRWANALHVTTKAWIVKERISFNENDSVTLEDLAEAEAILRNERYLRNANVSFSARCNEDTGAIVDVKTWDKWPLLPIVSFSRSGGENKSALGMQHDNLLGLGIRTRLRYTNDEERSGYQLTLRSAVHWVRHANVTINLSDNDDGKRTQFVFDKPFFHLNTNRMFYAEFLQDERFEDISQNGEVRNSYNVEQHKYSAAIGWQLFSNNNITQRVSVGFTDEQSEFYVDPASPSMSTLLLPQDRQYQYPWIAYEFVSRNIVVLSDINLIQQPEDINLGWRYRAQFGLELNDVKPSDDLGYQLWFNANKGMLWSDGLFLFDINARAALNTTAEDFTQLQATAEYFLRLSPLIGVYARLSGTVSENAFLDNPVVLDDDTGVRGYPQEYQHGDNRYSASIEARLYTGYNFYKLFNVGFAAFYDVGRAFGGSIASLNETDGLLSSAGIGARLYSDKLSSSGVVHIDLATPFTSGENIDSWEWRLQMRRSF